MNRHLPGSLQNRQHNNGMDGVFSSTVVIRSVSHGMDEGDQIAGGTATEFAVSHVHGHAPSGAIVEVHSGTSLVGSVTADSEGEWTLVAAESLATGHHTLTATVAGAGRSEPFLLGAGDAHADTATGSFLVAEEASGVTADVTAYDAPVGGLHVSIDFAYDDSGAMQDQAGGDMSRTNGTPRLSGTAPGDAVIEFYDNGQSIGSVRANALGLWTFEPGRSFASGVHALTAYIDGVQASEPFELTVVGPAVNPMLVSIAHDAVEMPLGELASGQPDSVPHLARLHGTAPQHADVELFDNGTLLGSARANGARHWTLETTHPFVVGTHAVTAYINGMQASDTQVVEVDAAVATQSSAKPAVAVTIAFAGDEAFSSEVAHARGDVTGNALQRLTGKAPAGTLVTLYDDDRQIGRVHADADGIWSFEPEVPFEQGTHALTAVVDGEPASEPVVIEVTAPVAGGLVTIDWAASALVGMDGVLADGRIDENSVPRLQGRAPGHSIVEIYDNDALVGTAITDTDGNWSFEFEGPLAVGQHELVAQISGGATSEPVVLLVEPVSPDPEMSVAPVVDDPAFAISPADPASPIGGMPKPAPVPAIGFPAFVELVVAPSLVGPVPDHSPHEEPALDFDRLINPAARIEHGYDPDGQAHLALESGDVTDAVSHLMGYAPAHAIVEIFDNDLLIGSSIADSTGLWQFAPDVLFVGEHLFVARAESAPDSEPFHLTVVEHVGDFTSLGMHDLFADEWMPVFADAQSDAANVVALDEVVAREAFEAAETTIGFELFDGGHEVRSDLLPELEQYHG
ncbi:hypothetical protein [Burkholderia ubonensis]|uniref:hypothetical protein n=1 Tax=Burkholderia ubonensis TaxID=101571 RepID=UPI000B0EE289|nr:hypothetical protein [Burkholderia ubonensis]